MTEVLDVIRASLREKTLMTILLVLISSEAHHYINHLRKSNPSLPGATPLLLHAILNWTAVALLHVVYSITFESIGIITHTQYIVCHSEESRSMYI